MWGFIVLIDYISALMVEYMKRSGEYIRKLGRQTMNKALNEEILAMLENDARLSSKDMAAMTGATEEEIAAAVKKLEEDKTIVKYTAIVNSEKTSGDDAEALIEVKVVPKRGLGYDDLAERIAKFHEVKSVYLMSGTYDLSVVVKAATMKQISQFVFEKLAVLEGVSSTVTHFIMRKYKEQGVALNGDEPEERLVISP